MCACARRRARATYHPDKLTQYSQEFAMSKSAIPSPELVPPVGPFSQAIEVGGFLYFSGQVAQDPATGKVVEGGIVARQSASSRTSRQFSRRPARVSMTSCAPVCFSRA